MPISFYGLTFLPFVALTGGSAILLRRRGLRGHARAAFGFTITASAGLAALALLAGSDLRAPTAVLAAQGALLLVLGGFARSRGFVFAGTLGIFGGLECGLLHAGVPEATHAHLAALAMLGALGAAWRLGFSRGAFARRAGHSVVDATAVAAVLAALLLGRFATTPPTTANLTAYGLVSAVLCLLGVVYRRPAGALLAFLPLLRFGPGGLAIAGMSTAAEVRPLAFAVGAAIPLFATLAFRRAGTLLHRPLPGRDRSPLAALPPAILVFHALGTLTVLPSIDAFGPTPAPFVGVLLGGATLFVCAVALRSAVTAVLAAVEVFAAGPLGALMFAADPCGPAGALGLAAGFAAVCGLVVLLVRHRRRETLLARPVLLALAPLALLLLARLAFLPLEAEFRGEGAAAGANLALAAAPTLLRLDVPGPVVLAEVAAGLAVVLVPVGLLDAAGARIDLYPIGLLAGGALAVLLSRGRIAAAAPALLHLAGALAFAVALSISGRGEGWLLAASFLLVAAGARAVSTRRPALGGTVMLLSLIGLVSLGIGHRVLGLEPRWQPALVLFSAAAAALAWRVRALAAPRVASGVAAAPFVAAGLALGFLLALVVAAAEPSTRHFSASDLAAAGLGALAGTVAAGAFGACAGRALRVVLPAVALLLAVFVTAPVNLLIRGDWRIFPRPDVEVALIAAVAAARFPLGLPRLGKLSGVVYAPAVLAILLTALELEHASTPLALVAATAVPAVLLLRTRRPVHAGTAGLTALLASWSVAIWAVPKTGRPAPEILPLLAAVSAALLLVFEVLAARLRSAHGEIARGFAPAAVAAGVAAVAGVAGNAAALPDLPARADTVVLSALATLTALVVALRASGRSRAMPHVAAGAVLALYGLLAARTGVFGMLDGFHLHVAAGLGAALLLYGATRADPPRTAFRIDALLLTAPVAIAGLPALAEAGPAAGRAAAGFLLAAAVWGMAATRFGRRSCAAVSVVLVNLAVFALWRYRDVVDPAFYGVPAGLSILIGTEAMRKELSRPARLGGLVVGAAALYGSVAVQVLRVEEPHHAVVLFALGLVTVTLGFLRDRNELLVAGTTVVILDVVAYLARHGFEESFLGAGLLVLAGLTVLTVGTLASRRRKRRDEG